MNTKNYIYECLDKLNKLGINFNNKTKDEITNSILKMPSDMLSDMENDQILGLVLDDIGFVKYDDDKNEYEMTSNQVYSFDMEVFDISTMYKVFLDIINIITNNELKISDIVEDISNIDFENNSGIHIVNFKCMDKYYKYESQVNYDWFDVNIINFINEILENNNSNKYLYVTSDLGQNCILFYNTEDWANEFNNAFDLKVEKA